MAYELYENNGVLKRKDIDEIIKLISKEERKKLWNMGIKIGRYHIFLPKMLKPKAVTLRTTLWKIHNNISTDLDIPKFGLNFVINENFHLTCLFFLQYSKSVSLYFSVVLSRNIHYEIFNKLKYGGIQQLCGTNFDQF